MEKTKSMFSYISQRAENHFYHGSLCNACCPGVDVCLPVCLLL